MSTAGGWGFTNRPAVTVGNAVGRGLIGGSGAKDAVLRALVDGSFIPSPHGKYNSYAEQTRITVQEAGILQTYPPFSLGPLPTVPEGLVALDLFAGHGWGVACQQLGIEEMGVELMPEAVATRDAAGMETIYQDVWDGLLWLRPVEHRLHISSPPCQTFSMAGNGAGRRALNDVLASVDEGLYRDPWKLHELIDRTDPRTALVLTPLAHVYRDMPEFVVMEQVPQVLPVWEACAAVMRSLGYSVWTGVLNAEQYGVPQTRRRAILIGRLWGEARPPTPTHSRYYPNDPAKLDEGVPRWISMAEALSWGMTARPYPTVATGTEAGGTDPAALGGSGARRTVYRERDRGAWVASGDADNDGGVLRLTDGEAGKLQTYPEGFPFQGGRGARFKQIGNAVPPLLGLHVIGAAVAP